MMLDAPGFAARLSLVDAEGQPLVQSDGPATGAGDGLIDVNVPAGTDFLEVQSLFGEGTFQITATLIPTSPHFRRCRPISRSTLRSLLAVSPALVSPLTLWPLMESTWVMAMARSRARPSRPAGPARLDRDRHRGRRLQPRQSPGHRLHRDQPGRTHRSSLRAPESGRRQFPARHAAARRSQPVAIQTIDFANGIVDLAVADSGNRKCRDFLGDGQGGFSPGPVLAGGDSRRAWSPADSATAMSI